MARSFALTTFLILLIVIPSRTGAEFADELVPAYSRCYDDLAFIAAKGLVPAGPVNSRPLTRGQIAGILAEGLRENAGDLLEDAAGLRLAREFADELHALGFDSPAMSGSHFWRGSLSADGGRAHLELIPYAWVRVNNIEPIYFRKLADSRIGVRGSFSTAGGMLTIHNDIVAGNHSDEPRGIPEFGTLNALIEGEDFNSWVHRAYLRLSTKILDVVVGRDWLRWGPGRTGTLGMGDAGPAHNLLLLRKRGGNFDFTTFVAVLDFGNEEMLAGHRLEVRLLPTLTVGLAEEARFKTLQQAPLYFFAFYPYSLVEKLVTQDSEPGSDRRNNVMWSVDFDWIPARGTRLYGEFLLDDFSFSSDLKPTQIGYQVGVARSGVGRFDALGLEAEFTKIHRYTYSQARRRVVSGGEDDLSDLDFIRNGFSLGHPIGPDSEAYYLAAKYNASAASIWQLALEVRRSGELELGDGWTVGDPIPDTFPLSGVVETSTRLMLSYSYCPDWWHDSWLTVGGGLYKVGNVHHLDGRDKDWDGIMEASLMTSW